MINSKRKTPVTDSLSVTGAKLSSPCEGRHTMNTYNLCSCQEFKIRKLTAVIEKYHDLPKESHYRTVISMIEASYFKPVSILKILKNHVWRLLWAKDGEAQNTPGASQICDCCMAIRESLDGFQLTTKG